jgi:chromosome segregation ATPase
MQKSAQLSLDMKDMQLIAKEKDNKIALINESLQTAQSTINQIQTENKQISTLKNNLDTIKKEKLVYVQQLDDFQVELQNQIDLAKQRFIDISTLQEQHDRIQRAHKDLQVESSKLATAHQAILLDLDDRNTKIGEFTETLDKKERVIQIYKEKLDKAADDIALLQKTDTNEQLNLVLILDELAQKTALAKELGNKLSIANNEAIASGIDPNTTVTINKENQALIDNLTLENDTLGAGINEFRTIIEKLEIKQAAAEKLLESFAAEVEQLQFLITDKDKELAVLRLQADGSAQQINQLAATVTAREEEVVAVKEQTKAIAAPLTEKITGLELEITQASSQITNIEEQLSQTQSTLESMGEEKQLLVDELASTKLALKAIQSKLDASETDQTALQEKISAFEQELASKDESIEAMTAAIAAATTLAAENETFAAGLNEQLASSKNEAITQTAEMDERISRLIDEIAAAKAVTTELTENAASLQARNDELLGALAVKEIQINVVEEIAVEAVIEEEAIIENEETTSEPENENVIAPETMEIIIIDEETEGSASVPESATDPAENAAVEEVLVIEDQVNSEEPVVKIVAEEILVVEEGIVEEKEEQTKTVTEEIPLQEDSSNAENL